MKTHSYLDNQPAADTESTDPLNNVATDMPMLKPAILLFILLSIILGLCYPLVMTAIAQVAMPNQANGSLIEKTAP